MGGILCMKKLTSLLLSAVMLLSAVAGLFETVSAESYVPYVINFDDGESIDRYIPNGNATEQKRKEKFKKYLYSREKMLYN